MKTWSLSDLTVELSKWIENYIEPPVQFLIRSRVQTAIVLAAFLVFTQAGQTIEIYRAIALDYNLYQAIVATIFVFVLTLFVWYTARFLVLEQFTPKDNQYKNALAQWGTRFLGIIPLLGLSLGIFSAWKQTIDEASQAFLITWMIGSLGALIFALILFIGRTAVLNEDRALGAKSQGKGLFSPEVEIGLANIAYLIFGAFSLPLVIAATDSKFSLGTIAIFVLSPLINLILYSWYSEREANLSRKITRWFIPCLLGSAIFGFTLPPTAVPGAVGAIGVVAIAFTILVVIFSIIYNWALENNIPALAFLVSFAIFFSFLNWNDNHQFRHSTKPQDLPLPALEDSFESWLASRPDRDQYAGKPYPVYLVSAQGGGIYAAYHAATALTKLTESMPNFPQHVFAISGVSGGSLGASTFTSLIKESQSINQPLTTAVSRIFDQDLLSPLLTLGLFPDLIQRFIPFPIDEWDRASGLEVAFENAWNRLPGQEERENPFKRSFYQHWQPEGIAPALVLNTTVVENGKRLVISPFKIELPTQENIVLDERSLDLKLSTAAGLSARFPFVTPVGWYQRSNDGSKSRLADGGYFDNSGIPTTIDIGRTLQKLDGYGESFKLVYLAIVDQQDSSIEPPKSSGLNEVLSPVRTLFGARVARSLSAIELSSYTLNDGVTDPFQLNFRTLVLQKVDPQMQINLPLGWQLSTTSKAFIAEQTPEPSQCHVDDFKQAFSSNVSSTDAKNHNSCVAKSIELELSEYLMAAYANESDRG
ncbi:patatin-like phospholipase family protein [Egbenema bharatensis]|uniref:patatin-like phospholipase family protein n=1 Tax=Egbenema bharatensis TaxID=3463334 RepID=UPI003A899DD8